MVCIVLNMLMSTRKIVTSNVILPGITSGLTKKEIHETTTNNPEEGVGHLLIYKMQNKKFFKNCN